MDDEVVAPKILISIMAEISATCIENHSFCPWEEHGKSRIGISNGNSK